jgi:hypothetical protein
MQKNHEYDESCPCEDCLRITFAARFGQLVEHEITSVLAQREMERRRSPVV